MANGKQLSSQIAAHVFQSYEGSIKNPRKGNYKYFSTKKCIDYAIKRTGSIKYGSRFESRQHFL